MSWPPKRRLQCGSIRNAWAPKDGIWVEGVSFPNLLRAYGWRASGIRRGKVGDRDAIAVSYSKGARRVTYVIVAGSGLPVPSGGLSSTRSGTEYRLLRVEGRPAVTWRRHGRTCVLIGQAPPGELLRLAAWKGHGTLGY